MNYSKLINKTAVSIFILGTVFSLSTIVRADETQDLREQVKALQQKVEQLENKLSTQNSSGIPGHQQIPIPSNPSDQWDPFIQMQMMENQMGQMMKDNMIDFNPQEDIKQTPQAYIISIDIPGMEKDKINLEVKNNVLIISGERNSEVKEDKPNQFYRQERSFGRFYRTIALPQDAQKDGIDAQYNNGVLTVKVLRSKSHSAPTAQKVKIK